MEGHNGRNIDWNISLNASGWIFHYISLYEDVEHYQIQNSDIETTTVLIWFVTLPGSLTI